jgi:hypothetical protein
MAVEMKRHRQTLPISLVALGLTLVLIGGILALRSSPTASGEDISHALITPLFQNDKRTAAQVRHDTSSPSPVNNAANAGSVADKEVD